MEIISRIPGDIGRRVDSNQGSRTRVLGTGQLPLYESVSTLGKLRDRSFEEVSEARAVVESQVMLLAAQRITRAELTRLARLLQEQQEMLEDPVRFQISDREFHSTLYSACRNNLLVDVLSEFYDYALEFRRLALNRHGAIAHSVAAHRAIVEAMKKRNAALAARAMRKHLDEVNETTRDVMTQ